MRNITIACFTLLIHTTACAQQKTIDFEKYNPTSTLVVPEHKLTKSKFPFIDVHNHQWNSSTSGISGLIPDMDGLNMKIMVNLSGKGFKETNAVNGDFDVNNNDYLTRYIENIKKAAPGRIILFTNISFVGFGDPGWIEKTVKELERDVNRDRYLLRDH